MITKYGYADEKRQIDALLIADIARDRIDTGLYGDKVYDVSSLNLPKRAPARRRTPTGGGPASEPATAAGEEPAADDDPALEDAGSEEIDLIVDGSAPVMPAAGDAPAVEEAPGDDDESRPRGAKVTTLRPDGGGGGRRKQGR